MTTRAEAWSRLIVPAVFCSAGVVGAVQARDFTPAGQWFPFYISLAIVVVGAAILVREAVAMRGTGHDDKAAVRGEQDSDDDGPPPFGLMLLWWLAVVGFAVGVYVVGMMIATPVFVVTALRVGAGVRWRYSVLAAAISAGVLWFLAYALQLPLPEGLVV